MVDAYPGEHSTAELMAAIRNRVPEIIFDSPDDPAAWRLHAPATAIAEELFDTPHLHRAAEGLTELIHHYREEFGLGSAFAANQVRSLPMLRMIGRRRPEGIVIMCNPSLSDAIGFADYPENCASTPNKAGVVEAPWSQRLTYRTVTGDFVEETIEDHEARVMDHEVRHLDGLLCIDPGVAVATWDVPGGRAEIIGLGPLVRLESGFRWRAAMQ